MMDVSDLKAASNDVLSVAACGPGVDAWVRGVLDFIDLVTLQKGLKGSKQMYEDLKQRRPMSDGGDPQIADWYDSAVAILDSMSADFA